jgi:dTDP-4-dehydrorhamnose reductase
MQRFDAPSTLIVGAQGRLGTAFRRMWPAAAALSRQMLDLSDGDAIRTAIEARRPAVIVNCAAMTDQRTSERFPERARLVNVEGVRHLREAADAVGAVLVHFSCDRAVYPVTVYAQTKQESEPLGHLTLRARLYDGSHPIWAALTRQERISLSVKRWMNPISTTALVTITHALLALEVRGVVEAGTRDRLSEYEVGRVWASVLGTNPELIEPTHATDNETDRHRNTMMSTHILSRHNIYIPTLREDAALHRSWYIMNRGE